MKKPKVHCTITQLRSAFKKHYSVFEKGKDHPSYRLLLFYAVECGLKASFLNQKREHSTTCLSKYFPNDEYGLGHNIPRWVEQLKIPANAFGNFSENPNDPIENLHEKLRYGVDIASENQITYLISLVTYLKKHPI